jgi:hypothetical protein
MMGDLKSRGYTVKVTPELLEAAESWPSSAIAASV